MGLFGLREKDTAETQHRTRDSRREAGFLEEGFDGLDDYVVDVVEVVWGDYVGRENVDYVA